MRTTEEKAKHAAYMREYYKDPIHKEKKKLSDKKSHWEHRQKRLEHMRQYYHNLSPEQKENFNRQNREWSKTHPQKIKEYKLTFYSNETPEEKSKRIKQDVARNKKNYQLNPQPIRDYNNKRYEEKRLIVLTHYSPNGIKCVRCGITDLDMLTMDHVHDDGHEHRKTVKNLVRWLYKNNFPEGFQVLCMSCQFIKRSEVFYKSDTYNTRYNLAIKIKVLSHYSCGIPKCIICGDTDIRVLTADHVEGNGNEHRRSINVKSGLKFYRWLIRNNYPDGFQVLCMNHQIKKAKRNKENCGRPRLF